MTQTQSKLEYNAMRDDFSETTVKQQPHSAGRRQVNK